MQGAPQQWPQQPGAPGQSPQPPQAQAPQAPPQQWAQTPQPPPVPPNQQPMQAGQQQPVDAYGPQYGQAPESPGTLHYERPPVDEFERDRGYGGDDSYDRGGYGSYDREYDRGAGRDRPFYEEPMSDYDDDRPRRRDRDDEDRGRASRRRGRSAEDYEIDRERRADRARLLGSIVYFLTGLICTSFLLHIVFNLFGANPKSGIVSFVHTVAQIFVFGLGDVFKPGDNTLGLVLNFGFAALVYFILGRLLANTLKQR